MGVGYRVVNQSSGLHKGMTARMAGVFAAAVFLYTLLQGNVVTIDHVMQVSSVWFLLRCHETVIVTLKSGR